MLDHLYSERSPEPSSDGARGRQIPARLCSLSHAGLRRLEGVDARGRALAIWRIARTLDDLDPGRDPQAPISAEAVARAIALRQLPASTLE